MKNKYEAIIVIAMESDFSKEELEKMLVISLLDDKNGAVVLQNNKFRVIDYHTMEITKK